MENIKLNEQIAFLRRQNNMTQEELAQALGVTNQAVSKWETSQCCPDIQVLPMLAKLFHVSIDELMGYREEDTFENEYLRLKSLFKSCPEESAFHYAFRLSILLHEAAGSRGYREYIPWDTEKNYGLEDVPRKWGFSVVTDKEGNTVYSGDGIFISDNKSYKSPSPSELYELTEILEKLADRKVLKVLYTLYEMTVYDNDLYVSIEDIVAKSRLSEKEVRSALSAIPVTVKEDDNNNLLYRIEVSFMYVPSLLMLLLMK